MDINGQRYDNTPTQRLDIQADVIYVGYSTRDGDPAVREWTIKKITLVGGNPTLVQWTAETAAVWDDRATETYT